MHHLIRIYTVCKKNVLVQRAERVKETGYLVVCLSLFIPTAYLYAELYIVFTFPFIHSYIRTYIHLSFRSFGEHPCQSFCVKVFMTLYYQYLLMELVYVLPIATCSSQILLHSILIPQLMLLGRAGGKKLELFHLIFLKSSLA